MSLSGAFLHIVKTEMLNEGLINSRVEKIHQPSREEIFLSLHTKNGSKKLLLSANPASARVCLTSKHAENPQNPPMFCRLLRKRLGNGRLTEISQDGFERIILFRFNCRNEIGDEESIILLVEIMGRSNNIILLIEKDNTLRIIDALKRITDEVSSVRRVLPGLVYEPPPRETRLSLINFTKSELMNALKEREQERLNKALIKIFEGICPLFAREAAFVSSGQIDILTVDLTVESTERLLKFLEKARFSLINSPNPVMLISSEKKPFGFTFIDIEQYGGEIEVRPYVSANALLDNFYAERANAERMKQRSGSILKTLSNRYGRVLRKIDARRNDLAACAGREKFRKWGDLISANIHAMEKGKTLLIAQDFETGENVEVPLDRKLTPAKNAQKYYTEYKKMQTAEKTLTELIKDGENELIYLDSVLEAASRAVGESQLLEIKRELIEAGYLASSLKSAGVNPKKGAKQEKPSEPMKFTSSDGATILVGMNNRQNDVLTLKTAKPHEIWLHTKDIAGSHVIVRDNAPSDKTLEEAAQLAAWFSKARSSNRVPVDYTEVKFVKKPVGAKPGMVIFTNNKTLYVTPNEELYNKLKT
ncbi:MAG: NFACT family protein [Oscillospiraceae bacterium]|jgi:predicted ribosome quality control (RQC) complex YloA/Tae2 family protein|nr:NFACT family protein [Oscillospiraceae bacterium]